MILEFETLRFLRAFQHHARIRPPTAGRPLLDEVDGGPTSFARR